MGEAAARLESVWGSARDGDGHEVTFEVVDCTAGALQVRLEQSPRGERLSEVRLQCGEQQLELGSAQLLEGNQLVGLERAYDFSRLLRDGTVRDFANDFAQIPLVVAYKDQIRPDFREYVSHLRYQIAIYRDIFDAIDDRLRDSPRQAAEVVRSRVLDEAGRAFLRFFDQQLETLAELVADFDRQEHERHGYYFRRQMWDVIARSPFLERTNVRPRGYAGDSQMMQWIYDDADVGERMFDRLLHRHPVRTAAAEAVRNRRRFVPELLREVMTRRAGETTRVMSVACGPAWELRDLYASADDAARLQCVLLDQDEEALAEAQAGLRDLEASLGASCSVRFEKDSVRQMLRTPDLSDRLGRFHCVYSMGLFDYLNRPVAEAVLRKLYGLLEPGGELLVGNFHVANPTRVYMDYWMDWSLIYRSEQTFLSLARRLPGASSEIVFEATGSQMFLRVRREAP